MLTQSQIDLDEGGSFMAPINELQRAMVANDGPTEPSFAAHDSIKSVGLEMPPSGHARSRDSFGVCPSYPEPKIVTKNLNTLATDSARKLSQGIVDSNYTSQKSSSQISTCQRRASPHMQSRQNAAGVRKE